MEASSLEGGVKLVSIVSGAPEFSIKQKQKDAIIRMLNLNNSADTENYWQDVWKVLLFDDSCRDILSPLLKVGELRKQGITLHLPLHSDRQPVPDVPAIYFVAPTKENVERICRDCVAKLYDSYYLNFSSSINRSLLEQLAEAALKAEVVSAISKIYDQYLHFVSLEEKLFSLQYPNSYVAFNDQSLSDTEAEAKVDAVVDSLFCVLATLQQVPIIRCPRNTAAEMVGKKLNDKLHEQLMKRGSLFSETPSSFQRPLLVLLDRNVDLTVMCHHTWTYQALVHDLLDMKLNTVKVNVTEKEKTELTTYDLDAATDAFWGVNAGNPVPKVAEEIQVKLKEYTSVLDEVDKLKLKDDDAGSALLGKTKGLGGLVAGITEHTEKKRLIDMHLNIATAIFDVIKGRGLDSYFSLEEGLMSRSALDKNAVLSAVTAKSIGTPEDKLRLFLIYYMTTADISNEELQRFEEALQESGADVSALHYLKKIKAFNASTISSLAKRSTASSPVTNSKSGLMRQGFSSISSLFQTGVNSIKMWIPNTKDLYVTKIVDALMELKSIPEIEEYSYFDPKMTSTENVPRKTTPFKEAVVFIIGGGNYVEYQNLQDYTREQSKQTHSPKQIIYGATEILTANQFLAQLSLLGQQGNK